MSVKAVTARWCIASTCSRKSPVSSRSSSAGLLARPCAPRPPALGACSRGARPGPRPAPEAGARLRVALQARPPGRPGGVGVLDHLAEQRAEGGRRVRVRRAAPPLVGLLGLAAGALARRRLALLALAPLRRGRLRARARPPARPRRCAWRRAPAFTRTCVRHSCGRRPRAQGRSRPAPPHEAPAAGRRRAHVLLGDVGAEDALAVGTRRRLKARLAGQLLASARPARAGAQAALRQQRPARPAAPLALSRALQERPRPCSAARRRPPPARPQRLALFIRRDAPAAPQSRPGRARA